MSERSVKAGVLTLVKRGTEHEMAEKIRKIEDVIEVLVAYGMWDIVASIENRNPGKLDMIITDMRQTPEVEQTITPQRLHACIPQQLYF